MQQLIAAQLDDLQLFRDRVAPSYVRFGHNLGRDQWAPAVRLLYKFYKPIVTVEDFHLSSLHK